MPAWCRETDETRMIVASDGPTPHLEGTRGDYAPTVLLPGDPKRARFIAESYFDDVRQVNAVRGAEGFTGTVEGRPVSVQAVGMGVASVAIYYTELIRVYGCENLIRVGSCGGLADDLTLGEIIIATAAGTDSAAVQTVTGGMNLPPVADWSLLRAAVESAERQDIAVSVGTVFTADLFYDPNAERSFATMREHGVLGVEMEVAMLYALATAEGARALGLLTISDDIGRGLHLSAAERESTFDHMIKLALDIA